MKLIKKIRKNKDYRVLTENFFYLSIIQATSSFLPLITLPYLAKVIGVDGFGRIAFAFSIILLFDTIVDWGFSYSATRDVAKNRNDKEKVSEIFSNVLWSKVLLMVISFCTLLLITLFFSKIKNNQLLIFVTFLLIPGKIIFPIWFFQAMERMKYITILNLFSKVIFTVAIFVFINKKSDFILQALFTSLGFILSGIISMYIILKKWRIELKKPNFIVILKTIKNSSIIFLENFIPNLYNNFSIMLVGFWFGATSNGILDAGTKFVDKAQQLINMISKVFFPFLARRIDKHDLYVKIVLFVSIVFSVLLFLFAPLIINFFYTSEFKNSVNILRLLSVTVFFMSIRNAYGTEYMILEGHEKELFCITLWTSIIGFILAFPLVYYLSYWGAAINIMLVKGVSTLFIVLKGSSLKKEKNEFNKELL